MYMSKSNLSVVQLSRCSAHHTVCTVDKNAPTIPYPRLTRKLPIQCPTHNLQHHQPPSLLARRSSSVAPTYPEQKPCLAKLWAHPSRPEPLTIGFNGFNMIQHCAAPNRQDATSRAATDFDRNRIAGLYTGSILRCWGADI